MTPITLRSAHAEVVLDPERGGEFRRIAASADSPNALAYYDWASPLSVDDGPSYGSTELDWLSRYRAGWQVLFPNAGAECVIDGVPVAFHGEASLARLELLAQDAASCTLRAVARLPLELTRTVTLAEHSATVLVHETVSNLGALPVPFLWGHHPTFPAVPGSRIDSPALRAEVEPATPGTLAPQSANWPMLAGADGGTQDLRIVPDQEQVRLLYLPDLAEGWIALRPPTGLGVAMSWDLEAFPHLWLWLQNGDPGFPWYGRARMLGLEPQRSWPFGGLAAAHARGQALVLQPGESTSSWITLSLFEQTGRRVTGVDRAGAVSF